jgi:hypothetical protein
LRRMKRYDCHTPRAVTKKPTRIACQIILYLPFPKAYLELSLMETI